MNIKSFNDSKDEIARLVFNNFYDGLDMFDQKIVYQIGHVIKDYRWLVEYVEAVTAWYEGDVAYGVESILIDGEPMARRISPRANVPKLIYRGLNNLSSLPQRGQSVVYLPNKGKITSWSDEKGVAQDFAGIRNNGIVLVVKQEDVFSAALPVLWPGHFVPSPAITEREWALYIKKPLKIFQWELS